MVRHPNYLGDLIMALAWSLPCGEWVLEWVGVPGGDPGPMNPDTLCTVSCESCMSWVLVPDHAALPYRAIPPAALLLRPLLHCTAGAPRGPR